MITENLQDVDKRIAEACERAGSAMMPVSPFGLVTLKEV